MIPYVNATLTQIAAPSTAPDYDQPQVDGTAKWSGSIGIYVDNRIEEIQVGEQLNELVLTRLEIPWLVGRYVSRSDTLTFLFEDASNIRSAQNIIRSPLVGRVRVTLVPA